MSTRLFPNHYQTIANRKNTITSQRTAIDTIKEIVQGTTIRTMQVGELERSLERIQEALGE
jgi:hypothetical protein